MLFLNMYILLPTIDMYIYKWIQLRNDRNSGALLILRMLIQSMRLLLILLLLLLLLFVFVKRIHVILLYVKCCSCAIRLVKQPKKAGTSQVVFLDWTLSWEVKKEQRKKKRKEEKTNQSMSIIFLDQIAEIKHRSLRLWKWCLHYTLLALMPQGESE